MKQLEPNKGIPAGLLLMMSAVGGLTVANLYYNQPLLEEMKAALGATEVEAGLITVITQLGYAAGLLLVVPLADKCSRRKIIGTCLGIAAVMTAAIGMAPNIHVVWLASFVVGVCSVVPQIFVPMAGLFSAPQNKSRNMGFVLSGLLTGVLGARVVSGYVGLWLGWRGMFFIATAIMVACLAASLAMLPVMKPTFQGSYGSLMKSVVQIFMRHSTIRHYSLRAALTFASMMCIWSCMAFHLALPPFSADSGMVGMLGLCGMAGAVAASGVGKYVPRFGIQRFSVCGGVLQLVAWAIALWWGNLYVGLILAIVLVDVGSQCNQLSNQSGCLHEVPEATNRANTIFMTMLFMGGSLGTFVANIGWTHVGWTGVCGAGLCFALLSLALSAYCWHASHRQQV